jgi:peptide/nickel transport system permease protein
MKTQAASKDQTIHAAEPRKDVKSRGFWRTTLTRLVSHPLGLFGAVIVLLLIFVALFGSTIAPYDPNAIDFSNRFSPPTINHFFGTDDFGRDIFSRVLYGARISLLVGVIAVGIAATLGTTLGLLAGYTNRIVDEVIMRAIDVLFAFPAILLAIAVLAILGKGVDNAMIAIGLVYTPIFARIARSAVLSVKNEEFVKAARSMGSSDFNIIRWHILPNSIAPLIVETSLSLAFAILAEAALSFFGLGTQPPDPSWGRMLKEGQDYFRQSVWMAIFPGLAIMLSVMGFNFLGDGLRDALDPKMKQVLEKRGK